jgi:hypothetical protein
LKVDWDAVGVRAYSFSRKNLHVCVCERERRGLCVCERRGCVHSYSKGSTKMYNCICVRGVCAAVPTGITKIFQTVLKNECVDKNTGRRRLVLDVGANFGYFTVYAAMMGCR